MVIRQNKAQAQQALDTAMKRMIEDKASMIISIEGCVSYFFVTISLSWSILATSILLVYLLIHFSRKRNEVGKLSDYKKGPAVFAIKTNATIIPVIIRGIFFIQLLRFFFISDHSKLLIVTFYWCLQ